MNGVLPVDKPAGPSSHDVVAVARRVLGIRRIGHTGTLDPFATGLLLLCLGPATRLSEYLTGLDKSYEATARLGTSTDTLDHTGNVTVEEDWTALSAEDIQAAFAGQVGTFRQRPPAFSAKKIGGRKAYELARAGSAVSPEPVEVTVRALEVMGIDGPDVRFRMTASSGTYVRAVARDVGEELGVGAHLTELRRTEIGGFHVSAAVAMDGLENADAVADALIPPLRALGHLRVLEVDAGERGRIALGQRVPVEGPDGIVAVAHAEELVAVAEADGGVLRPRKVFAS